MADYAQINDYSVKDGLSTGNPLKLIKGSEVDAELAAISTAIASKYDDTDIASVAQAQALTDNTTLITPSRLLSALTGPTATVDALFSTAQLNASEPKLIWNPLLDVVRVVWEVTDANDSDAIKAQMRVLGNGNVNFRRATGAAGAETFADVMSWSNSNGEVDFTVDPTIAGVPFVPIYKFKDTFTRRSANSLLDDPDLNTFVLEADTYYAIDGWLHESQASGAPNLNIAFQVASGTISTSHWGVHGWSDEQGTQANRLIASVENSTITTTISLDNAAGAFGTVYHIRGYVLTGGTAPTLDFQWTPAGAGVDMDLNAGSWIKFTPMGV